jgi:hypothetical protein
VALRLELSREMPELELPWALPRVRWREDAGRSRLRKQHSNNKPRRNNRRRLRHLRSSKRRWILSSEHSQLAWMPADIRSNSHVSVARWIVLKHSTGQHLPEVAATRDYLLRQGIVLQRRRGKRVFRCIHGCTRLQ